MQRVADWQTRIVHESIMHKENSFITLTYGPGNLPPNASLEHRDFQLFMKRLRFQTGKELRFYMCGEYGDKNGRPHYHACIFNHEFRKDRERGKSGSGEQMYESDQLTELWGMGTCTTQDLTPGTAAYAAGYIMKKTLGDDAKNAYDVIDENGQLLKREPPYSRSSNRPGIGKTWYDKHGKTDMAHDFIIQDGIKKSIPPYYEKLNKRQGGVSARIENMREEKKAKINPRDQWADRLKVREEVLKAKIARKVREL